MKASSDYSSVDWIEEISDQSFDAQAFGACTTNTFSLSDHYSNTGGWCTITIECIGACS